MMIGFFLSFSSSFLKVKTLGLIMVAPGGLLQLNLQTLRPCINGGFSYFLSLITFGTTEFFEQIII